MAACSASGAFESAELCFSFGDSDLALDFALFSELFGFGLEELEPMLAVANCA